MVLRPTPSALAISATVTSRASYRARASLTCSGESLAGRPPRRPRARAAARPTAARSAISSRSNSASAAKMWKIRRPVLVVVSIPSCSDANATPAAGQRVDGLHQMPKRPAQPVQPPHHQRVPGPQIPHAQRELRPLGQLPRRGVGEDLLAARRVQRVGLPVQVLGCAGDPGVADTLAGERVHRKVHEPRSCTETQPCDAGFRALIPDWVPDASTAGSGHSRIKTDLVRY